MRGTLMKQSDNTVSFPKFVEALWYTGPQTCEVRAEELPDAGADAVFVRTLASAVSCGTERLVCRGKVPETEWERMRAPFQDGAFPFPVKYGYACVGEVLDTAGQTDGQRVFCLHPHQTGFRVSIDQCVSVPDTVPDERAALAANMETALNALWDGKPSLADHICVVGGGVVGLLTAYLCARIPGTVVSVVDVNPARRAIVEAFGCRFCLSGVAPTDQDLVFHASASAAGLETALRAAGREATVVEMSWYGADPVAVRLGAEFHSRRLVLRSSQVGTIPQGRSQRWTFRRRLSAAMALLDDPLLDRLITHRISFRDLPSVLPRLLTQEKDVLAPIVLYP